MHRERAREREKEREREREKERERERPELISGFLKMDIFVPPSCSATNFVKPAVKKLKKGEKKRHRRVWLLKYTQLKHNDML